MVRGTDNLDMTIAVDGELKIQTKILLLKGYSA